jgi:hypothetical protein
MPRRRISAPRHSSGAATRARLAGVAPRQPRDRTNRADNSHPPRDNGSNAGRGSSRPGTRQAFSPPLARVSRHNMRRRFQTWQDITGTIMAVEGRREGSPSHPWGR